MIEFILKILPGVITAIVASYLAAKWSMRKFYSEKWWERKERAYTEIIDTLYDLLRYCEVRREDYGYGSGYSEDKMKELGERYSQAHWKIKKATDIGAFVVCPEAERTLKELRERPQLHWNENPPWDIFDHEYGYYRDALVKIVDIARKDLKASKA